MIHTPSIGVMIVLLVIVVLLFGRGKVASLGGELGSAIREFRKGLEGENAEKTAKDSAEKSKGELPPSSV